MIKIRRNDTVQVIKGKDRGKKGKVLRLSASGDRAIIEGLNLIKKHMRKTKQDQKGGIVSIEAPIRISNCMIICKGCNRPTRVGFKILADKSKVRICRKCKNQI